MDKRREANRRVKEAITNALFTLFQEKELNEITITEIVDKAGVARASFYRNYSSKEDVMVTLVRDVLQDFRESADYDLSEAFQRRHVRRGFAFFEKYEREVKGICRAGFGSMLLEELNYFHEEVAGVMPATSSERFQLYIYIGALYNTALIWLQGDTHEDIDVVTDVFCRRLGIEN